MARNLRAKCPEADELWVCDTNTAVTESFLSEAKGARVNVAQNPREVAEKSVCEIVPPRSFSRDEQLFYR